MTTENETFLQRLRRKNRERQLQWDPENRIDNLYRATEIAGELGEALNCVKKLERERLGIKGSRDTVEHLGDEMADVLICLDLIAEKYGIDLEYYTRKKFNSTSLDVGFDVFL